MQPKHAGRLTRHVETGVDQLRRRRSMHRLDPLGLDARVRGAFAVQSEACGVLPHVLVRRLLELAAVMIIAAGGGGDSSLLPPPLG